MKLYALTGGLLVNRSRCASVTGRGRSVARRLTQKRGELRVVTRSLPARPWGPRGKSLSTCESTSGKNLRYSYSMGEELTLAELLGRSA